PAFSGTFNDVFIFRYSFANNEGKCIFSLHFPMVWLQQHRFNRSILLCYASANFRWCSIWISLKVIVELLKIDICIIVFNYAIILLTSICCKCCINCFIANHSIQKSLILSKKYYPKNERFKHSEQKT